MTRGVRPLTGAFAAALLFGCGATAHAQITVQITADSRVVEGDSGQVTVNLSVTLSAPNLTGVTSVQWSTREGTANAVLDFDAVSPTTLTWNMGDGTPRAISVKVNADNLQEWTTSQVDERFFVVLENPVGATIANRSVTVTILDDDHPGVNERPTVQFLSALSRSLSPHGANDGQVLLQWRVPAASTTANGLVIRENVGGSCTFPLSTTDGVGVASLGAPPAPGTKQSFPHSGLSLGSVHCYSLFITYPSGSSPAGQIKGTPFSAAGSIAWKLTTGTTILTPPTVGADAYYVTDTLGVVHALDRNVSGGAWPPSWNPLALGQTNTRSAVIPRPEGSRVYLGTNSGGLHSVDGRTGNLIWSRNTTNGLALPQVGGAQAQPGGIFKNFGGGNDMLLVGTNAGASNAFYAFDPATGNPLDSETTGSMGNVLGMPVVDYASNRVFFLSSSGAQTVFAMTLGAPNSPDLVLDTSLAWNPKPAGGSNGSLVMRNNRFYFGDVTDQLYALHMDGTLYSVGTGDGPIKGFVWPDRRNDNVYFATTGKVHGMRDVGNGFNNIFTTTVATPSMVLQRPGFDQIYVGDGNGNLVRIDVTTGSPTTVPLEPGLNQIGAPSLDVQWGLLIVGSQAGNVYAVRLF